jgi:hypothetical protein
MWCWKITARRRADESTQQTETQTRRWRRKTENARDGALREEPRPSGGAVASGEKTQTAARLWKNLSAVAARLKEKPNPAARFQEKLVPHNPRAAERKSKRKSAAAAGRKSRTSGGAVTGRNSADALRERTEDRNPSARRKSPVAARFRQLVILRRMKRAGPQRARDRTEMRPQDPEEINTK